MAAKQVDILLTGIFSGGLPLAGGKVYAYEAGTVTPKATYTDKDKTTPATNPIILDANGRALVYADGNYKFVVKTSSDVLIANGTWDNLTFADPTGFIAESVNAEDYASFHAALVAIGSVDQKTLYVSTIQDITDDEVVTDNIRVVVLKGGGFAQAVSGVFTLTFSGGNPKFSAPHTQIFFNFGQSDIFGLSLADYWFGLEPVVVSTLSKNFLDNGNGLICQRQAPYTLMNVGEGLSADRWRGRARGTTVDAGTLTVATKSLCPIGTTKHAIHFANVSITGAGEITLYQVIDPREVFLLRDSPLSFSGKVFHDVGSVINYTMRLECPVGAHLEETSGAINVPSGIEFSLLWENFTVPPVSDGDLEAGGLILWITISCGAVVGKNFYFTDMQLERGAEATPFEVRPFKDELLRCMAFYEKSFRYSDAPADGVLSDALTTMTVASSFFQPVGFVRFSVRKAMYCQISLYNPADAAAGANKIRNYSDSTNHPAATIDDCVEGFHVRVGNSEIGAGKLLRVGWVADCFM